MAVAKSTIQVLSCLRRLGSVSALEQVLDNYFSDEELRAFNWLKSFVREHKQFPTSATFKKETGISTIVTKEPLEYYLEECRQRALFKVLREPFGEMREALKDRQPDDMVELCRGVLAAAHSLQGNKESGVITLEEAVGLVYEDEQLAWDTVGIRGVTTGWKEIDSITDGYQGADLNTLVGRPGRGKSWLLLNGANAARKAGSSVLVISNEMNAMPMARRMFGLDRGFNPDFVKKGTFSSAVRKQFLEARQTMNYDVPFWFVSGNFKRSTQAVRALAEELQPDIIYVDASYLLIPEKKRFGSSGRRESVSDTTEELKQLTLDMNRPLLQTVQFNRTAIRAKATKGVEQRGRGNPIAHLSLEKIGETDVIGQASSLVFGIESHESDESKRYLGLLKGREGESGYWTINFKFSPPDMSILLPSTQRSEEAEQERVRSTRVYNAYKDEVRW